MTKKNRPSVLKRQREAGKRDRQAKKAAKAALKRENRVQETDSETLALSSQNVGDRRACSDPRIAEGL